MKNAILYCLAMALGASTALMAQTKRPITPADCVTVRYLLGASNDEPRSILVSPDGKRVAYLVKSPNLKTNENDIELYVKEIASTISPSEKPVAIGRLSRLQWLTDSRHLTVLAAEGKSHFVKKIDVETGAAVVLLRASQEMDEYVTDGSGNTVVFVLTRPAAQNTAAEATPHDITVGYRIPFQGLTRTAWPVKTLFVTRLMGKEWSRPERIQIESPFTHRHLATLTAEGGRTLWLSLSPDGEKLSLQYSDPSPALPQQWRKSPWVQWLNSLHTGLGQWVMVLYHLKTEQTTVPLETPFATTIPLWAPDSRSFVVFAKPPIGSALEQQESKLGPAVIQHGHTADLFWVQPDEGKVEIVATHQQAPANAYRPPLYYGRDESLLIASTDGILTRFSHREGHWEQGESFKLSMEGLADLASEGIHVLGDMQSPTTPPTMFIERLGDPKPDIFARLNSQFDSLSLAMVKSVRWKTSGGKSVAGTLFLPPDYHTDTRYPLVIQTKPYGNWFVCDQGAGHFPSFIPQPLASAGIAYLGFYFPNDHDGKGLEDYYPKGLPGHIGEAMFNTDVYDSAIKSLAAEGIVDPYKVGIIGFSSTGFEVEFALMHGKTRYRAATVADNVEYSFSEYAMGALIGTSSEQIAAMYGGLPYGSTLKNWADYSISFNVDKIHTPLLMEEMGHGRLFDRRNSPPSIIARTFELFTGLNLLHKPVEYYYYPNEDHQPDHPQARLANLQRNLDWYRFWLQGYERTDPEDPEQYVRWRAFRKEQDENKSNEHTDNSTAH